jgi:hypothetical protein
MDRADPFGPHKDLAIAQEVRQNFHPLGRALGLYSGGASPSLRETVCDLATRLPYRQIAEVTSRITHDPLSPLGA